MVEPGDHDETPPVPPAHDPDHEVGFFSPQALAGHVRRPEPVVEPAPQAAFEPEPEPVAKSATELEPEPELDFDAPPPVPPVIANPPPKPPLPPEPVPTSAPDWRDQVRQAPTAVAGNATFSKRANPQIEGVMGLYAIYALILLAVPTLGVSAIIGLLAVLGRQTPTDPVARSHYVFQQRTLLIAAGAAVLGALLIIVGLGVFVLFILALWTLVRGAFGVMRLRADKPIGNPQSWLI